MRSSSEISWSELLRTVALRSGGTAAAAEDDGDSRRRRRRPGPPSPTGNGEDDDEVAALDEAQEDGTRLRALVQQLERYCRAVDDVNVTPRTATAPGSTTSTAGGHDQVEEEEENEERQRKRRQCAATVRDTRLALRFGAAWVASASSAASVRADDDDNHHLLEDDNGGDGDPTSDSRARRRRRRERLQLSILEAAETYLYRILHGSGSRSSITDRRRHDEGGIDDAKCRLFAARLLCNLVTDNAAASRQLLVLNENRGSRRLRLDPGRDELVRRQRRAFVRRRQDESGGGDDDDEEVWTETVASDVDAAAPAEDGPPPNWLDMVGNNAEHRDVLAAIVATLHNAVAAVEADASSRSLDATADRSGDGNGNGNGSGVVGAARRVAGHGLLVNLLLRHVVPSPSVAAPIRANADEQPSAPLDDASDWIMVLLRGLVRRGHLRTLYRAVSARDDPDRASSSRGEARRGYGALPEHVVLLFCLRQQLENEGSGASSWLSGLCEAPADAVESVVFLADLYDDLQSWAPAITPESTLERPPPVGESTWRMERVAVQLRVLDLLGDLLQDDSNSEELAFRARSAVGRHPNFLRRLSLDLTSLVDLYAQRLQDTNNEPTTDAPLASAAPRDRIRVTIPPQDQERLTSSVRLVGNLCYRCRPNQDLLRSIATPAPPSPPASARPEGRNVLHVLLTSTSLAPYCFTLREWAVVAIRNALEDNAENQSVLADLQAQQPATSAALADMGVRIDMDAATGAINVVPLDN